MSRPWISLNAAMAPVQAIQRAQGPMLDAWNRASNGFGTGYNEGWQRRQVEDNQQSQKDRALASAARAAETLKLRRRELDMRERSNNAETDYRKLQADLNRKRFDMEAEDFRTRRDAAKRKQDGYTSTADLLKAGKTQDAAREALRSGNPELYSRISEDTLRRQKQEIGVASNVYSLITSARSEGELKALYDVLEKRGIDVSAYRGSGMAGRIKAATELRQQLEKAKANQNHMMFKLKAGELGLKNRKLELEARKLERTGGQDFTKLPEHAAKAASFTSRMVQAEGNIRDVLSRWKPDGRSAVIDGVGSNWSDYMANKMRSTDAQRYRQSAEQWIRAFLRKESGAAISASEFENDFRVYFPQPGDTPETIRQKEVARAAVMRNMGSESRGFFTHNNPEQARILQRWLTPTQPQPNPARGVAPAQSPDTAAPANPSPAPQPSSAPRVQPNERALTALRSDPSPEAIREFAEFHGMSVEDVQRLLQQQ